MSIGQEEDSARALDKGTGYFDTQNLILVW